MGEEEEDSLNFLSMKDFKERGIKIDKRWTGLDALAAVASLASKKLEEERIRKEKQKMPVQDQSKLYYQFPAWKLFGQANSPSEPRTWLTRIRVSVKKQKQNALRQPVTNDLHCKKSQHMGNAMKAGFGHDVGDWVAEYTKQKKLKRGFTFTQDFLKPNKKPKRERPLVLEEIPNLPQEFKERIQQLNGSKMGLVIQKSLFPTDVSDHHYRLSIPVNQIVSKEFLTEDEKRYIDNGGEIKLKLIEPLLQQCEMTFKRADKPKEKNNKVRAKSSFCYVLIKDWIKLKDRNKLKMNDTIQLWKFRLPNEQLCLALVLVDRNGSKVCEQ